MKLRFSPTSPFVRKVRAVAVATGLDARIENVRTETTDPSWWGDNPLGKVPALVTDDGRALIDSPVICEYLDSLHDGPKLFPPDGEARWTALQHQALADGIMDACVSCFQESRRPDGERSPGWIERQRGKVERTVAVLEAEAASLEGDPDIGNIAVGCALGYIGLRMPDFDWRTPAPHLAKWYEAFAKNPFMTETAPPPA